MDMRMPPLNIKIMLGSSPLKSRILVRRLAVAFHTAFSGRVGSLQERAGACEMPRGAYKVGAETRNKAG